MVPSDLTCIFHHPNCVITTKSYDDVRLEIYRIFSAYSSWIGWSFITKLVLEGQDSYVDLIKNNPYISNWKSSQNTFTKKPLNTFTHNFHPFYFSGKSHEKTFLLIVLNYSVVAKFLFWIYHVPQLPDIPWQHFLSFISLRRVLDLDGSRNL